jgi:stage V sporulation protein AB
MINVLIILIGLGGGFIVGGSFAAFIVLLEIIPRLTHISQTHDYKILYQYAYILGVVLSTIVYFADFSIQLNNIVVGIIGLIFGTYIGVFSSALAEVLNVVPVMAKKFRLKNELEFIIYALILGKIAGSLFYWLKIK